MSNIEEQIEDDGYVCPYCKHKHICDDWGHDFDGETLTCSDCGKNFYATANHSTTYEATPNCELNNDEHNLEYHSDTSSGGKAYFCSVCNQCEIKTKDEL